MNRSASILSSPRPRFRYYAVRQQASIVARDLISGRVTKGNDVAQLESRVSEVVGTGHALATPQCTTAIFLAISALTEKKKKVILSPYTIHDVINMVICAGGEPVFADIERETSNISVDQIEQLIDGETAAVIVTHLHGLACDLERIWAICRRHGVAMVEDAAQSFGARVNGKMVGTFGDVGVYSFSRAKTINALYGGMLVTNRSDIADAVAARLATFPYFPTGRLISQAAHVFITNMVFSPPWFPAVVSRVLRYGYEAQINWLNAMVRGGERDPTLQTTIPEGYLYRMTPMQARMAKQQLGDVDRLSAIRREYAKTYHDGLKDVSEIIIPPWRDDGSHIYVTFPIQAPDRDSLIRFLLKNGRDVQQQHLCNNADAACFSKYRRDCPNARETAPATLLLPTYPSYGMLEVERNVEAVRAYYHARRQTPRR